MPTLLTAAEGSLPTDLYPDQPDYIPDAEHAVVDRADPDSSNPNSVAELAKVENMSAPSGAERPSGNRTVPSDFYMDDTEIEVADEGSPVAGDMAGTPSLVGRDAWRDGPEQDLDVPPSPRSSGYAGQWIISWRKRKKHYFLLSHSGKPIFSR
ncbi:hypothetical protein ZIOFF_013402 [Zingiber officinale]|uniref:Uncharacterized protein n=1 Tax=Zingiber officinale TaxID=94328 RepID=A0A8J5HFT0_ZINOF|nr:hypothetical protein ZIOFF_013402 [Zingiber officinale]